jgi:RNA-binding protein
MPLNTERVDSLQILAHDLKPVIAVGAGGLTDSLVKQLQRELAQHQYVQIRIPFGNRERRQQMLDRLLALSGAELVQRCGYEALLHRPQRQGAGASNSIMAEATAASST